MEAYHALQRQTPSMRRLDVLVQYTTRAKLYKHPCR